MREDHSEPGSRGGEGNDGLCWARDQGGRGQHPRQNEESEGEGGCRGEKSYAIDRLYFNLDTTMTKCPH